MVNKPRIGITSGLESGNWHPDGSQWRAYADAIEAAGGIAVHLGRDPESRDPAVLKDLDALMLPGGRDVHLASYPNPPSLNGSSMQEVMEANRMRPEPLRDEYELALFREALQRDMPVLGVCRGIQVMNVGLGGRLILDIEIETQTPLRHTSDPAPDGASSMHALQITPGTLLAQIMPPEGARVCNSRHHQAVRVDDAFNATISAVSPDDGLVEAIEVPQRRWVLGVQWHPEHRVDTEIRELYAPLFRAFIDAAR
jgi:putative glutamine amidotransferase